MSGCEFAASPDIELDFYGELDAAAHGRVSAHLRECPDCRQRFEDLHAIRRALAAAPVVDAPPAGDWSGFMRRLDAACGVEAGTADAAPRSPGRRVRTSAGQALALAAMVSLVTMGVIIAARFHRVADTRVAFVAPPVAAAVARAESPTQERSLREVSAEHLERSKLVVLGLATLDPKAKAADWQYERQLAGTLLSDTRLYRMAAQDRGMTDVARVMRDLETVLIEASMSDNTDRNALERVQKLISRRDLVVKMQVVASNSAGI
jgi:hypothetical protein